MGRSTTRAKVAAKSRSRRGSDGGSKRVSATGRAGKLSVKVLRLAHAEGLPLPAYQSTAAAGLDLVAAVDVAKPIRLKPGSRALIPTGLVLQLPAGTEGQVRPRSGLALKAGVTVLNSPGTIDADYRGEVQVILVNHGEATFVVRRGERIAQLIVARVQQVELVETRAVSATGRGGGGFGSTGRAAKAGRKAGRG